MFLDDKFFDLISRETVRYTTSKGNFDFTTSADKVRVFVGTLIFLDCNRFYSLGAYWSIDEDLGRDLVKQAMSRNQSMRIKENIHFVENDTVKNLRDQGISR